MKRNDAQFIMELSLCAMTIYLCIPCSEHLGSPNMRLSHVYREYGYGDNYENVLPCSTSPQL